MQAQQILEDIGDDSVPHALWLEQNETKELTLFLLQERERLINLAVNAASNMHLERRALNTLQKIRQLDTVLTYVRRKQKPTSGSGATDND